MSFFNFEKYSFVIKIAIVVNKAVLDDITKPTDGIIIDKVELIIVESPLFKTSVEINNTFSLFKLLYFFL